VEEIDIDEESLAYLGEIGQQTSLRLDFFLSFYCSSVFSSHSMDWFPNMRSETQVLGS
jgi:hypothetical protein